MNKKQLNTTLKKLYDSFKSDLIVEILLTNNGVDVVNVRPKKYTLLSDVNYEDNANDAKPKLQKTNLNPKNYVG